MGELEAIMSIFRRWQMIRVAVVLFLACLPYITFAQTQGTPVNCYDDQFIFNQDLLIASTGNLLFRVTNAGWKELSTPSQWHQLRAVQDKILYLYNDDTKELFRSTDQGATWQMITQLPFAQDDKVRFYPSPATNTMMVSVYRNVTFPGHGELYKSIDDGMTWQQVYTETAFASIYPIRFSPAFAQDGMIFANVYGRGTFVNVLKSVDAGQSWAAASNGLTRGQNTNDSWLIISPQFAQDQTLFVATQAWGLREFYKTVDAAASWQRINISPLSAVHAALSPTYQSDQTMIIVGRSSLPTDSGIYISHDGGTSFQQLWQQSSPALVGIRHATPFGTIPPLVITTIQHSATFSQTLEFWAVVKPEGEGSCRLYRSVDQGQSWEPQTLFVTPYAFYLPVISQAN
ncbi:MAG: hypothetical protein DYG89_24060 [Caldilinea sp. CFX5]|nr:hypothetical protein [Caldilinea sp. CFX5]